MTTCPDCGGELERAEGEAGESRRPVDLIVCVECEFCEEVRR